MLKIIYRTVEPDIFMEIPKKNAPLVHGKAIRKIPLPPFKKGGPESPPSAKYPCRA